MGFAKIEFDPRTQLHDFLKNTSKISLIRRTKGKKSSKNMLIWGENLSSLAALKAGSGLSGKSLAVEMIIIDPPYNVGGNQGYRNVWKGESEKERDWAGDHGEFLDFMEPRLKVGRSLLTDDGVMFVNICDSEYCSLKILMDEIFSEENWLGTIIWNKGQGAAGKHLTAVHEFILVYAKNAAIAPKLIREKPGATIILNKAKSLKESNVDYKTAQIEFKYWIKDMQNKGIISAGEAQYNLLHPETYRPMTSDTSCAQDKPETRCHKKLEHPITKKGCKVPTKGWKWSERKLDEMYKHNKYYVGSDFVVAGNFIYGMDETRVPRRLWYLDEKMTYTLPTMINVPCVGPNDLPKGIMFSTPKPIELNKILISSYPNKNITVLDYFAGSGATAHAVHKLNSEDDGERKWIMIEEMGSTFNNVLVPRVEYFDPARDFTIYENKEAKVGTKQLADMFNQYSFEFLSAYHEINDEKAISLEGMNILGYEARLKQVVALTTPCTRRGEHFFEEELALLKDIVKRTGASKILIYTISKENKFEEPWLGVDKSILHGTKCRNIEVVELPEKLVEEWNEFLIAMAA